MIGFFCGGSVFWTFSSGVFWTFSSGFLNFLYFLGFFSCFPSDFFTLFLCFWFCGLSLGYGGIEIIFVRGKSFERGGIAALGADLLKRRGFLEDL